MRPLQLTAPLALTWVLTCVCLSLPSRASAHAVGLSQGNYVLDGATLQARLTFANAELANALPDLDADQSGTLSSSELQRGRALIESGLVQRLEVHADGTPCPVRLDSWTLTDRDGVALALHATCAARPSKLLIHCGFFELFSAEHRQLAHLSLDANATARESILVSANPELASDVSHAASGSSFGALLRLGVEHILTGYDHLVFLFGLILLGGRLRSLIAALTAFTVAHSISLALAVLGVWAPRAALVEPAIAASIAYVGFENLWHLYSRSRGLVARESDAAHGRWRITFPFGLIHGFGFAGALAEIGLPRASVPGALLAFNLGVELGQLAVLAVVLPLLAWARQFSYVRYQATLAADIAIVLAGLAWFVARVGA